LSVWLDDLFSLRMDNVNTPRPSFTEVQNQPTPQILIPKATFLSLDLD
jgi:hypothetical protein